MRALSAIIVFTAGLVLAGCASTPSPEPGATAQADDTNDPFEGTNRQIFAFNMKVDRYLVKPSAETYVAVVPEPARDGHAQFPRQSRSARDLRQ